MNDSNEEKELDIDFESEDELGSIVSAQAKIKKLRSELQNAQQKRDEYLAGWQREKADGVNLRKETMLQAARDSTRKLESLAHDILPALDSFDMASASEAWASIDDGWRNGMENVQNQLLEALRKNGIERYGKAGDMYSPHLHEAVHAMDDVAGESGSIVRVLRYGYKLGDRILRPAQVIVKS